MKISEHFHLEELVHPEIFKLGDRCENFLNPHLPVTLEDIRRHSGPIKVNDYHIGGNYKNSGLRSPKFPLNGKGNHSGHYFGVCADLKFSDTTVKDVYYEILNNPHRYPHIIRLENIEYTPTWLHIEVGERIGEIVIFNP